MGYMVGGRNKKTLVDDDKCPHGAIAQVSTTVDGKRYHRSLDCIDCKTK